ncbi:FecR family protein [Mucilaginibacter sp.]|uniref:FecR family protein n=1 Tax=Mucilaginibacter sp. TaxID=1882438 RepID=UPI003562F1CD
MNEERFKALFEQYLNDSLPSEDLLELQGAIQDDRYRALFDDLLKNAFKEPAFAEADDDARQSVFNAISSRINQQENTEPGNTDKRRLIPYRWLTGVAALLFLALGAGWFFLRNNDKGQRENTYAHNIKPGINKATLTLANGKKLILTDSLQGQLASEVGVKISKTRQGQIVYTVVSDNDSGQQALQYNTLTTKRSEQFQVILPDGSHVWLDAASSLKYPVAFKGNERKVELTGQGYFEVSHNAATPFIVKTAKTEVQVLGTHFNVSAYDDDRDTKTTLLEGAVRIKSTQAAAILKPGEQAVLNDKGQLTVNKNIDASMEIAWKNGLFDFKKAGIREIMVKASRWYDIDVKYEGRIPETKLTGRMSRNVDISGLLGILQFEGIKFRIEGKTVIVTD